mmetsp:Transcript_23024/g.27708  ORF Transcript_23024/g.27708 Transcript_23024/m.27708 type:complete len:80 (+) Transcript_23024:69-308(+)|eukprot:CAMPEP_0195254192 /NCGR_PEP_ID=MMETSP0706-20130129/4913_1 /TAXON_ID=33640 /ORGANISM="Asterionellopsis glacialis, Strain CCMP134" /LENGTH=79 /DNA_ID=CAMNT_0040306835 /DNA_START=22 /DNA_END=261 /DNA_ORIENTATION=-
MKLAVATLVAAMMASTASAFAPAALPFTRGVSTQIFSSEPEEEEGLDLDLGEMFEMFDAADKEENFEEAAARIKANEEK